MKGLLLAVCLGLIGVQGVLAQSPPRLVQAAGVARDAGGNIHAGSAVVTFSIYATQKGGDPLWQETQSLTLDAAGQYSTLLGLTQKGGLPEELFTAGEARWLAVSIDGGPEGPRMFWASVPYALKAGDADTVGGMPLEAFVVNGAYRKPSDTPRAPKADVDGMPASASAINDDPTDDLILNENLIVRGSTCTGLDCPNVPAFGFDTLRLQENNLRIHFNDTSNSASFPTRDWRIVANDTTNGGANYLAIEDSDAGTIPFRVEANAGANALVVNSNGNIGFGTIDPVVEMHSVDGDSPTLRLEQNGSSGFTPQTWDLAGNETNFFIRDVTNGSLLPFRIRPNTPANSLYLEGTTGNVGLRTASPAAALHVNRSTGAFASMLELTNNSGVGFVLNNTIGNRLFISVNNSANSFNVNFDDGDGPELSLSPDGALSGVTSCTGCAAPSDRNLKENFAPVNRADVLKGLLGLDVSTWNYKAISPAERHIGPMSQDFFAAFSVGRDVTLSPVDTFGVTTAAIQALSDQVSELQQLVADLKAQIEQLKKTP